MPSKKRSDSKKKGVVQIILCNINNYKHSYSALYWFYDDDDVQHEKTV